MAQNNQERIADLEKKLRELNVKILVKEKENEKEIESLKKENQELKEKESFLIVGQMTKTTKGNMCEYVLGKKRRNRRYNNFKEIDKYIETDVKPADQDSAKKRLEKLKEEISWDQDLVDSLKNVNQERNSRAHPELSSEKIQQAIEFLKEKGELDEQEVENMYKLKTKWETSEDLLRMTTFANSEETDQNDGLSTSG